MWARTATFLVLLATIATLVVAIIQLTQDRSASAEQNWAQATQIRVLQQLVTLLAATSEPGPDATADARLREDLESTALSFDSLYATASAFVTIAVTPFEKEPNAASPSATRTRTPIHPTEPVPKSTATRTASPPTPTMFQWQFQWTVTTECDIGADAVENRVHNANPVTVQVTGFIKAQPEGGQEENLALVPPQYESCPSDAWCGPIDRIGDHYPSGFEGVVWGTTWIHYQGKLVAQNSFDPVQLSCGG